METIIKIEEIEIKGKKIKVEQEYYYDKDIDEYFDDEKLGNENLRRIRNAYRKETGLLSDTEIKDIRNQYNLNQRNFSLLLGFGEITITRYESKNIQEKAQDIVIRSAADPKKFMEYVKNNKESYLKYNSIESYDNLIKLIENRINNDYSNSGNTEYDENKFLSVISYIKSRINVLTKTKLAKYLWYIDFKAFKEFNKSITGLTYIHNYYGAYPVGFNDKLSNDNVIIEEQYSEPTDSMIYLIQDCKSKYKLNEFEKDIINQVIKKFKDFNTKDLVDYMHKEDAYINTKQNELINYKYAKTLSI